MQSKLLKYFAPILLIHCSFAFAGWEVQQSGNMGHFYGVNFINEHRGWTVGDNNITYETKDGGLTWARMKCPTDSLPASRRQCFTPHFLTEYIGFMGTNYGKIFSTYDGGITWKESVVLDDTLSNVGGINFIDSETGWAIVWRTSSDPKRLYHTIDGGKTWKEQSLKGYFINVLKFLNARTGWALIGQSETLVYRTDDGGDTWQQITKIGVGSRAPYGELTIISPDTLWVSNSYFALSTDGGYTWNETAENVLGLYMADRLHYWKRYFVGKKNITTILYTEDGGSTFTEIYSGPLLEISGMSGLSNGMLWIATLKGQLMKYTPNISGISEIKTIPRSFEVYQNSPNPFNSSTSIRFLLSSQASVNLYIYDILGRKTRILFDNKCNPGSYIVSWDGRNDMGKEVTSGIFFYKLSVNAQTETKKMLLLR